MQERKTKMEASTIIGLRIPDPENKNEKYTICLSCASDEEKNKYMEDPVKVNDIHIGQRCHRCLNFLVQHQEIIL